MALRLWRNQHPHTVSRCLGGVAPIAIYASALAANGFLSSTVGKHELPNAKVGSNRERGYPGTRRNSSAILRLYNCPHIIATDAGIATLEAAAKSKDRSEENGSACDQGRFCHQYENEEKLSCGKSWPMSCEPRGLRPSRQTEGENYRRPACD